MPTTLSFFATTAKSRRVILTWHTSSEIKNLGFNIFRAESENGKYIKINNELIPTRGSRTEGAKYEFIDKDLKNGKTYYYNLESIGKKGRLTMHKLRSATPRLNLGAR